MNSSPTHTSTGPIHSARAILFTVAMAMCCAPLASLGTPAQTPAATETQPVARPAFRGHHIRRESTSLAAGFRDDRQRQAKQCEQLGLSVRLPDPNDLRKYFLLVKDTYYTEHRMTEYTTISGVEISIDCQRVEMVITEKAKVVGAHGACSLNIPKRKAEGACTEDRFTRQGPTSFKDPTLREVGTQNILGHICQRMVTQHGKGTVEECRLERKDPWLQTATQQANRFLLLRTALSSTTGYQSEDIATLIELDVMVPWSVSMPHLARGYSLSDPMGNAKRR